MIAKLIVHDVDRAGALRRLRHALERYEVAGLTTNLGLLQAVASHPAFEAGEIDTGFLERYAPELLAGSEALPADALALACAALLEARAQGESPEPGDDPYSPWARTDAFRLNEDGFDVLHLRHDDTELWVRARVGRNGLALEWADERAEIRDVVLDGDEIHATIDAVRRKAAFVATQEAAYIILAGRTMRLEHVRETAGVDEEAAGGGAIRSPMPGKVIAVLVVEGEHVAKGQALVRLEAMKMEHTLHAATDGVVERLSAHEGEQVDEGVTLLMVNSESD
jgi:3-methylcrotonyl-CoA carboxylase alpha subunit